MVGRCHSDVVVEFGEPLDSLCANRSHTMLVVGGRNVLKALSIGEDKFVQRTDLRKTRKYNVYFSGSLAWSPLRDGLIALTSSTGSVLLWDLENPNHDHQYRCHKKAATKVCFSEFNDNLLLSGSKESTALLYDLRIPEPIATFGANDAVRDLQFCLDSTHQDMFVMADDSGTVKFWDIRRGEKPYRDLMAHTSQAASSVALNPHSKNLIATGGRDRFIRVWDWSSPSMEFCYAVEVWTPVSRVSWCPYGMGGGGDNSLWHIASCLASSPKPSSDNGIHVWDIRRPYVPFATFYNHIETVTGDRFISCGKDGRLVQHFAGNASHPIEHANTVALGYNCASDELAISVPLARRKVSTINDRDNSENLFRGKIPAAVYTALPTHPLLYANRTIAYLATNYKLVGGSFDELCEWNAATADRINLRQLAFTWRVLALLCSQADIASEHPNLHSGKGRHGLNCHFNFQGQHDAKKSIEAGDNFPGHHADGDEDRRGSTFASGSITHAYPNALISTDSDFFFGIEELNLVGMFSEGGGRGMESNPLPGRRPSIVYSELTTNIREEAFEFRHPRADVPLLMGDNGHDSHSTTESSENENGDDLDEGVGVAGDKGDSYSSSTMSSDDSDTSELSGSRDEDEVAGEEQIPGTILPPSPWDPVPRIKATLEYYSSLGDAQTCAVICLLLGNKLLESRLFKPQQIDVWLYQYLEILERLQLWTQAALILKASYRPKFAQMSNDSTFVKPMCLYCRTTLTRYSARCRECRRVRIVRCSICDEFAKGVWSGCSSCGHGGHVEHMREWFQQFSFCPFPGCACGVCHRSSSRK